MIKVYQFKIISTGEVQELRFTEEGASDYANFLCEDKKSDINYREKTA